MMAAHDATQISEASPIHPQALSNWRADEYRQQLYVFEPLFFAMGNTLLQDYYAWSDTPSNIRHKTDTTTRILFEPYFQQILSHSEASSVLRSLEDECDHPDLPFITDDEALILLVQVAPFNQRLLQHRSWQYHKNARYNHDDSVLELRMFVMFVYHAYINPAHYQSSQVLCEDLSIQLTDILHKLHTEATNLLTMELYARNQLTMTETISLPIWLYRYRDQVISLPRP